MRHLIFDFDGVLGDTLILPKDVYQELHRKLGYGPETYHQNKTNGDHDAELIRVSAANNLSLEYGAKPNSELIAAIFEYQTNHDCRLAIITNSTRKFVDDVLNQSNTKLEFDFILSLEDGLVKSEKFNEAARFWNLDVLDLYYFTDSLNEVKNYTFLDSSKVFGCTWGGINTQAQMLEYMPQTRVLNSPNQLGLILPPNPAELVENSDYLQNLEQWSRLDNRKIVVGAMVINQAGKVLIQKRSTTRRLFPDCWDVSAGGHLEIGETIFQALKRELFEETGLELDQILGLIQIYDWKTATNDLQPIQNPLRREFDFIISCKGDLNIIKIEKDKVSEIRWIGFDELEILKQDQSNNNFVYHLVRKAFEYNQN